jgi:hypothetical protein
MTVEGTVEATTCLSYNKTFHLKNLRTTVHKGVLCLTFYRCIITIIVVRPSRTMLSTANASRTTLARASTLPPVPTASQATRTVPTRTVASSQACAGAPFSRPSRATILTAAGTTVKPQTTAGSSRSRAPTTFACSTLLALARLPARHVSRRQRLVKLTVQLQNQQKVFNLT